VGVLPRGIVIRAVKTGDPACFHVFILRNNTDGVNIWQNQEKGFSKSAALPRLPSGRSSILQNVSDFEKTMQPEGRLVHRPHLPVRKKDTNAGVEYQSFISKF
jgi:hypothetical protein